jgi:hypothetical protein
MKKTHIAASLVTVPVAALLLATSPPTCGCIAPSASFLYTFGIENGNEEHLNVADLQNAANKNMVGKPIRNLEFAKEVAPELCRANTKREYDCDFWFLKGVIRDRGFTVTAIADEEGNITKINVSGLNRVFGSIQF